MANNHSDTERRLWNAADEFRANSDLKSSEYATPVLGLIFLRYADHRFTLAEKKLKGKGSGRRKIGKEDYQAKGVMYLPPKARFSHLLSLPEGENIGKAINDAMKAVEADNEELKGVLPKNFTKIENSTLVSLLKNFSQIAVDAEGDTFGKIYEYFLGNFARAEGQRGGEFFTPTSLVKLIVEIIEPYHGRILDPASGSGGMFAQSGDFIKAHKKKPSVELSCFGQERVGETRQLCLMNLAVHSMSGDIRLGNSYYEDLHDSLGKFDFVMANPPFNVDKVDKEKIKDDPNREFPFFRVGHFGRRILENENAYFFHDLTSYVKLIRDNVPNINDVTMVYLKEAMQAFKSGCMLAATVMLGVAAEHSFLFLLEAAKANSTYGSRFSGAGKQRTILPKVRKFKAALDQHVLSDLPADIKEDIDTDFAGILSVIRTFRNESGHPTGKILGREQTYVLLQLFVPYCKRIYRLIEFFK